MLLNRKYLDNDSTTTTEKDLMLSNNELTLLKQTSEDDCKYSFADRIKFTKGYVLKKMEGQNALEVVKDDTEERHIEEVIDEHDRIQEMLTKLIKRVKSTRREVKELRIACQIPKKRWNAHISRFHADLRRINLRN